MLADYPQAPDGGETSRHLPRHVAILGVISFLTAMSSAMVYGLLPVFLVRVLGAFPLAGSVGTVLAARVIDRMGKGLRDAPRDAFMTDVVA